MLSMKTINNVVADRLCKYLEERKISQYRLSQLSGVPFPTIKSIMQRRTNGVSLKTVIMLSNGLGIPPRGYLDDDYFLAQNIDLYLVQQKKIYLTIKANTK